MLTMQNVLPDLCYKKNKAENVSLIGIMKLLQAQDVQS